MSSETPLSRQIRLNQLANERATAQRDQAKREQKAQEQAQAQAELDQYNADAIQYNIDLENYNRELAEIEKQQAQYDADVLAYEQEKIRVEDGRKAVNEQFDKQEQTLSSQYQESVNTIQASRSEVDKRYGTYTDAENRELQRAGLAYHTNSTYNTQERVRALNQYEFKILYPNAVIDSNISQAFKSASYNTSYTEIYEKYQGSYEAQAVAEVERSKAVARANREIEKSKLKGTIAQFQQQKAVNDAKYDEKIIFNATPTKAGDLKKDTVSKPERTLLQPPQVITPPDPRTLEIFNKQQQAKQDLIDKTLASRPQKPLPIMDIQKPVTSDRSNAFLTKPPQDVKSIIGKDTQTSEQAVFTFEQTQKQQKELFQKLTQAKTSQEAIAIKEQYQKLNPYVGTKQTAKVNGGIVAEQGTDIEKRLASTKQEFELSLQPPKETTITTETQKEITTITDKETFGLKYADGSPITKTLSTGEIVELKFTNKESAERYKKILESKTATTTTQETPSFYGFADKITGKPIKPNNTILWTQANILIETKVQEPTKADIDFNKSLRETLKTNPNIEIYKDTKGIEPLVQEPLVKGLTDVGTEFVVIGEEVISFANPNYERKIKNTQPSLETTAFSEGVEQGKYLLAIPGNEKPKESNTMIYLKEKLATPEGSQYLAGSIIGSGVLIVATGGRSLFKNPLKESAKESKALVDIAEQIFKKENVHKAKFREQFPDLPETELNKMVEKLYPTAKTEKEIKLTNMLKQNTPNLTQERIDFIVSQANKADAIKLFQRQTQLKEQLKERFPGMTTKQIDQKVATMTAKESDEIPYSIEKLGDKQYLISAGRETKESTTPFIVVNFKKGRFGKEQGTYDVYEAPGNIKPTDLIIQGVSKTELKGGQVISKSKSSTVTRYPTGQQNIYKVTDPNQKDLALIGSVKTGDLATLKKYPKETIESMLESDRKTAILETKHELDALIKMEKSARTQYDLSIEQAKQTKITKQTKTDIDITKQTATGNKNIMIKPQPTGTGINITPANTGNKNIMIKPQPTGTGNMEKLKGIAKDIETQKATDSKISSNIKAVSSSTLGIVTAQSISQSTQTAQAQKQATQQSQKLYDLTIGQQSNLTISIPDKIEITKQRDFITEKNIITEKFKEKYKNTTIPRFSLIVVPGLGEKLDQGMKLDIIPELTTVTTQKELEIFKYPKPPKEPPKPTGKLPGGLIIPDLSKKEKEQQSLKGLKAKTVYFSWNVNLQEPGRYLPTKDLVVGTNPKILNRTNKIQRQVSKGSYRYKLDQQVTRRLDKNLVKEDATFKPTNRKESFKSKVNKSNLRNIDQSLVKKSKFIKKTKFKF